MPGAPTDTVTVRYFAAAKAAAGVATETVPVAGPLDKDALFAVLNDLHREPVPGEPTLERVLAQSSCLVDGLSLVDGQTVEAGATVDVLPPFAGG